MIVSFTTYLERTRGSYRSFSKLFLGYIYRSNYQNNNKRKTGRQARKPNKHRENKDKPHRTTYPKDHIPKRLRSQTVFLVAKIGSIPPPKKLLITFG